MAKVIDISAYQGNADLSKLKEQGISGVILRSVVKSMAIDSKFMNFVDQCINYDIPVVGIYMYLYINEDNYKEYGDKFISAYNAYQDYFNRCNTCLILDIENAEIFKNGTAVLLENYLKEKTGKDVVYYTYLSMYAKFATTIPLNSKIWIARYPSTSIIYSDYEPNATYKPEPIGNHELIGWQFSSRCKVNGFNGYVDISEWYSDINVSDVSGLNPYKYPTAHHWFVPDNYQTGEGVSWIQWHLCRLGFLSESDIDGKFGPKTHAAVLAAQKHYGFYEHGVVESEFRDIIQFN